MYQRITALLLAFVMLFCMMPVSALAADAALTASLAEAKSYIDGITINNSSNDPATVVKNFKTHFTWDNEKRENSKDYLFDWSYYNGVVFEGIEYVYEITGEEVYKDYVIEYMSSLITSSGGWATCTNSGYTSKQCAGYNATHGADCYKTASLLLDAYEMTGDSRYLTMAATLYADLDSAATSYSLANCGSNYRHTWASDPSPDLWLDGLYMILPFRAEYAKYIGDTEELDLIVDRMQWVSDNMYNSSKGLFYHAADSASSNSGTYWLRSIGWYAAAIVDIMDSMEGDNLEAMKKQLVKLVDGMKACQNSSNGMWLNNMAASESSTNPYETSGTALTCYAVMKAVNNGWLDESYADMAILAFNGICNEKLSGSTLTDICFKGAPGSSNSTFYDNEGKGVGPFIMFYAEVLEYVNTEEEPEETEPEVTEPEATEPEATEPEVTEPEATEPEATEPEATEPEATEPEATEPEEEVPVYQGSGNLEGSAVYTLDSDGVNSGEKYLIVYSGRALQNNNGVDNNPTVSISNNTITLSDDSTYAWTITQSGSNYYVENNGSYMNLTASGTDPIGSRATVSITRSGSTYKFRNTSSSGAYLRYSNSQLFCAGTNNSNNGMSLYCRTTAAGSPVVFTVSPAANSVQVGQTLVLNGTVTVNGTSVDLNRCTITWTSSVNSIATVSGGTVTGVAAGSANITATLSAADGTALMENIVLTIPVTVEGHSYESVVTAPTCTAQGYTTHTCTDCGDSYVDSYTAALGHNYKSVVTAPTCTSGGYTTYTCETCGDSYISNETAALGHSYKSVTVDATCTEDGSITYTCTCGDSYVEVIEATGHDYTSVVTAPTCTTSGYTTYTCGSCGDSYIADEIAALGHDTVSVVTEATCETGGYTTHTCTVCGDITVTDETAALDHDYETVTVEPTCTTDGSITTTCTRCGETDTEVVAALGHDYEAVVTDPTCTEAGYTTYTCACGDTYVSDEVAALGHKYESVTVDATCTVDGSVTYTCHCGDTYTEVIEATGHSYEAIVTAPTCTEAGYTTYTCICGEAYVADEVAALGHNYEAVVTAPTCTEGGYTTYTCVCGEAYVADEVAALGHTYEAVVTAPTCTEGGYTTHTCACGDSYVTDETAALGHSYESVTVEPTCTENGAITYTCTCGDSYAEVIEAIGHDYTSVVTEPTCTEKGCTTYTCGNCGDIYTADEVAALGHSYKSVTVDATCTEDGSVTHTCTVCGDSYVEVIEAPGHDYASAVTAPTCIEGGYTTYTCAVCGDSYVSDEIDALGHSYESVTVDATCTENGSVTYTCHCGDTYTEVIEATGHNYTSAVTEPTCTEDGYTTYTCACGDSYISDETAALGHTYEAVVTAPTCTESGYTTYTCTCGESYVADEVAALGHSYESVTVDATCTEDGSVTYTCACGDSYAEVIEAIGHDYTSIVTEPTCTDKGYTTYTCANCGDVYTADEVAALGHTYESVTVDATCTEDGSVTYTCHCGDSYAEVIEATDHSYVCTEGDGCLVYTCANCGDSYTEVLASEWISLSGRYVLDTDGIDIGEEHKYIVVGSNKNYALTLSGSTIGYAAVTVENNTITLDDASKYEFYFVSNSNRENGTYLLTQDGSKGVYHVGGAINYGHDSKGYWYFGSSSNGSYQLYDYDNMNWYLNYGYVWGSESVSRFAVSSTARSVRLFKGTDAYVRLSGQLKQSWSHDDCAAAADILEKVSIETSIDGVNVAETIAITSDMVTWNTAFDGTTAGTYTATVTYNGVNVGTITVTVTGSHVYESVVTDPTCVKNGSITYTCSCGDSYAEVIEATGHSYTCTEGDGSLIYTCGNCGNGYTEILDNEWISMSGRYVLDTDGIDVGEEHKYIVVGSNKNYALTLSGSSIGYAAVTVENNTITLDDASKYEFYFVNNSSKEKNTYLLTQDGSKGVYHMGGNMYYGSDNKGYWYFGSSSNGSYQLYDYDNLNWYLNYGYVWGSESVSRFAVSSTARSVRLFKSVDSYVRLSGRVEQTISRDSGATASSVLENISLELSTDGSNISETIAVTSDMVTWDTAFDGTTAGTYTATVTYSGSAVGTITVIVTESD